MGIMLMKMIQAKHMQEDLRDIQVLEREARTGQGKLVFML